MNSNLLQKIYKITGDGYIVGGILRDYFLKRLSYDIDIILPSVNLQTIKKIAENLHAVYFVLDEDRKVYRFITKRDKIQLDISAYIGKNLKEDLLNRDFSLNALAYPLKDLGNLKLAVKKSAFSLKGLNRNKIIDYAGSLKDINAGIVSVCSDGAFTDDPLRMIRVFRFAAQCGFKINKKTIEQVKKDAAKIVSVSGERVQEEILKILNCPRSAYWFKMINKSGLLKHLVPQLESAGKCAVVYYGKGGVLTHTFKVMENIEFLFENLKTVFPKFHKNLCDWKNKQDILKLTALLHDIAKPETAKMMGGRLRFFFHEGQGAKMAAELLKKWRFSRNNVRLMSSMIKEHLRIGNLASNPLVTNRAVYRFFRDTDGFSIPLLILCWADYASYITTAQLFKILKQSHKKPFVIRAGGLEREGTKRTLRHLQIINLMLRLFFCQKPKIIPKKLADGNDVMKILKIKPSPKVGKILESLRIAQVEKKVKTRTDALKFIKKFKK
jgi:tRNA nucleotidyltransferase/poly(A) polymerase